MGDISRLTIIFAVAVLLQQELLGSRVLAENRDLGGSCDTNNDCRDNDPTMICVFLECRCAPGYSTDNQNPYECQGCGRNLTGSTGTFTSPNHPDEYPWGGDCRWHITVPPGMFIWLSFSQFAIEREDNCTYYDTVSVYDSSTVSANSLLAKLCGVDAPGNYTSTNNVMTVRLTMNSEESEDGFVASYISFPAPLGEPCGNDNHCGDNELTEICQNSTCVCAPGYTQEGSECTEEVSDRCECTMFGDPAVYGYDDTPVPVSAIYGYTSAITKQLFTCDMTNIPSNGNTCHFKVKTAYIETSPGSEEFVLHRVRLRADIVSGLQHDLHFTSSSVVGNIAGQTDIVWTQPTSGSWNIHVKGTGCKHVYIRISHMGESDGRVVLDLPDHRAVESATGLCGTCDNDATNDIVGSIKDFVEANCNRV